MSEEFGPTFVTVTDEDGKELVLEFVDALAETVNDNPLAFSNVCAILFGKEQRKRLYDFLRGDDGRVHITAVSDCIREVMDAIGDAGKN